LSGAYPLSHGEKLHPGGNSAASDSIESELKDLQRKLITLDSDDAEYNETVNKILSLKKRKLALMADKAGKEEAVRKADDLMNFVKSRRGGVTEYDDVLVRKMISKILIDDESITVTFKTGYETVINK
jgi:site-specific DNA recombinase